MQDAIETRKKSISAQKRIQKERDSRMSAYEEVQFEAAMRWLENEFSGLKDAAAAEGRTEVDYFGESRGLSTDYDDKYDYLVSDAVVERIAKAWRSQLCPSKWRRIFRRGFQVRRNSGFSARNVEISWGKPYYG